MRVRVPYRARVPVLGALALLAGLSIGWAPDLVERRVDQLAAPWAWSVIDWESRNLPVGLLGVAQRAIAPPPREVKRDTVRTFLRGELPPKQHDMLRVAFAEVIEEELRRRGVASLGRLAFPPVAVAATGSPRVLAVSPRPEIRLQHWVLLPGELELRVAEELERSVERLDLSALVVRTGGISTYPTIAPIDTDPQFTLQTVAHEWTHTALFFTPLGLSYGRSPEARAINETTADVVGTEVATAIATDLGVPPPPKEPYSREPNSSGDDILADLRRIRQEVDARLAAGDVVGAEAYMEEQRRGLEARGYRIRRLNQAYFAFHGNYAEGPAASTEVLDDLHELRDRSGSLGDFIGRAGAITSLEELRRAIGR